MSVLIFTNDPLKQTNFKFVFSRYIAEPIKGLHVSNRKFAYQTIIQDQSCANWMSYNGKDLFTKEP